MQTINNWKNRITPNKIVSLKYNEIILFGSNGQGQHFGGLARYCYDNFGAKLGVAKGPTGQCYAINTMTSLKEILEQIPAFIIDVTHQRPDHIFYVTLIGCGITGYTPEQIAPMFEWAKNIENVYLPQEFWNVLLNLKTETQL